MYTKPAWFSHMKPVWFSHMKPVWFSPDGKCGPNGIENHSEDPRGKGFYCNCNKGYGGFCCDVSKYMFVVSVVFGVVGYPRFPGQQ